MIFSTHEASISYRVSGDLSSGVPLVFLPGALGASAQLESLAAPFPDPHLFIDFPGQGESTTSRDNINIQFLASETLALLQHLGLEAVDVIGYSLGGYVGLAMNRIEPTRIRSVVTHAMKFYWTPEAIKSSVAELHSIETRSQKAFQALSIMHEKTGILRTIELTASLMNDFEREALKEEHLGSVSCPVLVSVGDRDELVPISEALALYQAFGGRKSVSLSVLPATRHQLHFVPLETFTIAIREFRKANQLS